MLNKISGLARALYIVLAIIAGFVALGRMNVALVLVVLGLIAGISMPRDRMVLAGSGQSSRCRSSARRSAHIPTIGAQLSAVMANLQLGVAGALASAMAIALRTGDGRRDGHDGCRRRQDSRRGTLVSSRIRGSAAHRGGAFFMARRARP